MKDIKALNNATIVTIIAIVIMTIAGEIFSGFKSILTSFTGHHWTSKSVLAILIFFLVYMLTKKKQEYDVRKLAINTLIITVIGMIAIFLFFVYEFVK